MRGSVVAVTFLGTLACNKSVDPGGVTPDGGVTLPDPVPHPNPPPPTPAAPAPAPVEPVVLNGTHPEHGRIFRSADGTCRVNLPFPAGEGPPVSFRPPPTQVVDCPVHMADPSWSECFGTVTTGAEGGQCLCAVIGNPPPPPRVVPCPKSEG